MKKLGKAFLVTIAVLVTLIVLIIRVSAAMYPAGYVYRCIVNGQSKVTDYLFFPERAIAKSSKPYHYAYIEDERLSNILLEYASGQKASQESLEKLLKQNDTMSLIVIHKDAVVYERYFNGSSKDSTHTSFSSVKSINSLLIGAAIDEGYIGSEMQPIADFIPEFKGQEFAEITIRDLLLMRSPIYYKEGLAWFTDDAKTYYMPDLRNLALNNLRIDKNYSGQFHYNNYHPLLLGIIIERSTGKNVSDYLQEKIWDKVGAEYQASWSLDSEKSGFEKMESGLNFRPIDYAKIGSMLLHGGQWNGNTVLSEEWINRSTVATAPLTTEDIDTEFIRNKNIGYQYMWYSTANDLGGYDFFAAGKYGQYIFISPENDVVIVRTGISTGSVDWWPDVFKQIARAVGSGF